MAQLDIDPKRFPVNALRNRISSAKNELILPDAFDQRAADPIALVAPNGTGKTTLLDCITNLNGYQSGQITVNGID